MTYIGKIYYNSKKPERVAPGVGTYSPDRIRQELQKEVS